MRELENRCARLGFEVASVDAILVTHEHGDHVKGVGPLARKYGMPVWMTHGTARKARCGPIPDLNLFHSHGAGFTVGDIEVKPFAVPHDAAEPSQFVFMSNGLQLGVLTDVGSITPHLIDMLSGSHGLLLECNHDLELLRNGPYPPRLQARVGGDYGHLNNQQSADLLARIAHDGLQQVVIGHISEKNNRPELAIQAVQGGCPHLSASLEVLQQGEVSRWFELTASVTASSPCAV